MGMLYLFALSFYGSASSESRNTWWRSDWGRFASIGLVCVMYSWMFVFVSLQPLLLKSQYVVMFKQFVVVWSLVQMLHECMVSVRQTWSVLAWGVLEKSSKSQIEWVEVFFRAQLMVKSSWILYVSHYCYTFVPRRLDLLVVLVMHMYRLVRQETLFRESQYWWRSQCIKATAPIVFLLHVCEPAMYMLLICFDVHRPARLDFSWLMILMVFFVLMNELSQFAWKKKEAIVRKISNIGTFECDIVWLRCLPEIYGAQANVVLSIASYFVVGDALVFLWPVAAALIDWFKNEWLEARLKKAHTDNFDRYVSVCKNRYSNECI
jgi:hypothetical protein